MDEAAVGEDAGGGEGNNAAKGVRGHHGGALVVPGFGEVAPVANRGV